MSVLLARADARALPLADASVQCCVTSPPYYGLRRYAVPDGVWGGDAACPHDWTTRQDYRDSPIRTGDEGIGYDDADATRAQRWVESATCSRCGAWRGCLGLEPHPRDYVDHLVAVFREVRRVLRPDGVLWLNIGDSYASRWGSKRSEGRGGLADNERSRGGRTRWAEGQGLDRNPLARCLCAAGRWVVAPCRHHLAQAEPHA